MAKAKIKVTLELDSVATLDLLKAFITKTVALDDRIDEALDRDLVDGSSIADITADVLHNVDAVATEIIDAAIERWLNED